MTFDEWWESQVSGLGDSHKFTAWNAWLAATQFEREACAKVCEELGPELIRWWGIGQANAAATECATAIRVRSNEQN